MDLALKLQLGDHHLHHRIHGPRQLWLCNSLKVRSDPQEIYLGRNSLNRSGKQHQMLPLHIPCSPPRLPGHEAWCGPVLCGLYWTTTIISSTICPHLWKCGERLRLGCQRSIFRAGNQSFVTNLWICNVQECHSTSITLLWSGFNWFTKWKQRVKASIYVINPSLRPTPAHG